MAKAEPKRHDCREILKAMEQVTHPKRKLWGTSIAGFGFHEYRHASRLEGDSPMIGVSPRRQNIPLYITTDYERFPKQAEKPGKFSTGKSYSYIRGLRNVDRHVLQELIIEALQVAPSST